jgi:hypothetical protein
MVILPIQQIRRIQIDYFRLSTGCGARDYEIVCIQYIDVGQIEVTWRIDFCPIRESIGGIRDQPTISHRDRPQGVQDLHALQIACE